MNNKIINIGFKRGAQIANLREWWGLISAIYIACFSVIIYSCKNEHNKNQVIITWGNPNKQSEQ